MPGISGRPGKSGRPSMSVVSFRTLETTSSGSDIPISGEFGRATPIAAKMPAPSPSPCGVGIGIGARLSRVGAWSGFGIGIGIGIGAAILESFERATPTRLPNKFASWSCGVGFGFGLRLSRVEGWFGIGAARVERERMASMMMRGSKMRKYMMD